MMLSPYALRRFRLASLFSLLPILSALLLAACSGGRDTSVREETVHTTDVSHVDGERAAPVAPPPVTMGETALDATTSTTTSLGLSEVAVTADGVGGGSFGGGVEMTTRSGSGRADMSSSGEVVVTAKTPARAASRAGATRVVTLAASASTTSSSSTVRGIRATEAGGAGLKATDGPAEPSVVADEFVPADRRSRDKMVDGDVKDADDEGAPAPPPVQRSGQLTAGEWNDLREWNFWNGVMGDEWGKMREYWKLGSGARITVQAQDGERPVIDAVAQLYSRDRRLLWTARTDNHGIAELYTGLDRADASGPFEVVVKSGDEERHIPDVKPGEGPAYPTVQARFRSPSHEEGMVDVMFAIDATGSMGDELEYIKAELENVIDRVRDHAAQSYGVRVGANVYRDVTDDYLVRPYPFTQKMDDLTGFLRGQYAGGGGDTPEAVEASLADAIDSHEWSTSARARLLFLVLDAPPHHTDDRLDSIAALVRRASERGIHVIPVASSGVDKETEFLLRMLALQTNGTYVFLTDHSGIGNSHIKPTIGDYKVEFLNDLLVRLIIQYSERYDSMSAVQPRVPAIR